MNTTSTLSVVRGDLTNGLDSIEGCLGYGTRKIVFINEYYANLNSFPDLAEPAGWVMGDMAATLAPVVMAGRNAALLILSCPKALIENLADMGLITRDANIVEVMQMSEIGERRFPEAAVITTLQKKASEYSDILQGRIIVPSFVTPEAIDCAERFNGATLLTPQESIDFNSKAYLRRVCETEGISMPPGIISNVDDLSSRDDIPQGPAWLKLPNVAGGGTMFLPNGVKQNEIKAKIFDFIMDAAKSYTTNPLPENIEEYDDMPSYLRRDIVVEADMNALGNVDILGNFCCQAVIGHDQITYVGNMAQITNEGDYVGGRTLTPEEESLFQETKPEIERLLIAYQRRGYRGYIGVDVLVGRDQEQVKPFIMEVNCRMNASTPFLSIVQKIAKQTGQACIGDMISLSVPARGKTAEDLTDGIFQYFNEAGLLYTPQTGQGIIPFMPDIFPNRATLDRVKVRCALVGKDAQALTGQRQALKRLGL